ncbi:hypothetical protein Ciccas_003214 [Cichlidogyrus casuarinus]|uniref:Uncharacterized protein n=1 Tax=Cichlidogyrus casuarinus TaxID=1844966 RepID=A0ABD2QFY8_9PLAT
MWDEPNSDMLNLAATTCINLLLEYFKNFYNRVCTRSIFNLIAPLQARIFSHTPGLYLERPFLHADDFSVLRARNSIWLNLRSPSLLKSPRYAEAYLIALDKLHDGQAENDHMRRYSEVFESYASLPQDWGPRIHSDLVFQKYRSLLQEQEYCDSTKVQQIMQSYFRIPE